MSDRKEEKEREERERAHSTRHLACVLIFKNYYKTPPRIEKLASTYAFEYQGVPSRYI
jgi:hypothetical protein